MAFSSTDPDANDSESRGRRRAASDSLARFGISFLSPSHVFSSEDRPVATPRSLNRSMSLKRLKRISKRLSIIPVKDKEQTLHSAVSRKPRANVGALLAGGEKSLQDEDLSMFENDSFSDEYDLISDSDEYPLSTIILRKLTVRDNRVQIAARNQKLALYRSLIRQDQIRHRSVHHVGGEDESLEGLDASFDLLESDE